MCSRQLFGLLRSLAEIKGGNVLEIVMQPHQRLHVHTRFGPSGVQDFVSLMKQMKWQPPDFISCLLRPNDPRVEKELLRLSNKDTEEADVTYSYLWPAKHRAYAAAQGIRWGDLQVSHETSQSNWYPVLSVREQEILAFQQRAHGSDVSTDLGQNLCRNNILENGICPTLFPRMQLWIGDPTQQRLVLGRELLGVQGFPWQNLPEEFLTSIGEGTMLDLAGNAYNGLVIAPLCSCLLSVLSFVDYHEAGAFDAVDDTLEAIAFARGTGLNSMARSHNSGASVRAEDTILVCADEDSEEGSRKVDDEGSSSGSDKSEESSGGSSSDSCRESLLFGTSEECDEGHFAVRKNIAVFPNSAVPTNVVPTNVVPENVVSKNVFPTNVVPNDVVPKNVAPKSAESVRDVVPTNALPNSDVPKSAVPKNVLPNDEVPKKAGSQNEEPKWDGLRLCPGYSWTKSCRRSWVFPKAKGWVAPNPKGWVAVSRRCPDGIRRKGWAPHPDDVAE
jgi:hypothetical protein